MITLADAKRVLDAAERKAEEIGQPMNIAVVDAGGNLVAHVRMDKAWIGSVDIAINKAWTARALTSPPRSWRSFLSRATSSSEFMSPITAAS
jgi:uncharacterized protein GlcG (DUF336 family)